MKNAIFDPHQGNLNDFLLMFMKERKSFHYLELLQYYLFEITTFIQLNQTAIK